MVLEERYLCVLAETCGYIWTSSITKRKIQDLEHGQDRIIGKKYDVLIEFLSFSYQVFLIQSEFIASNNECAVLLSKPDMFHISVEIYTLFLTLIKKS